MESEKWYGKQQCNNGQKVGGQLPVLPNRLCHQCLFGDTGQPDATPGKEVGRTKSDSVCVSVSLPRYIQHSWFHSVPTLQWKPTSINSVAARFPQYFTRHRMASLNSKKWKEVSAKAPSEHLYQTGTDHRQILTNGFGEISYPLLWGPKSRQRAGVGFLKRGQQARSSGEHSKLPQRGLGLQMVFQHCKYSEWPFWHQWWAQLH